MTFTPNYLAILVAAISTVVLGFLWYGPLFGKPWMKLMDIDPSKMSKEAMKGMNKTYALMSIGSLVLAYVLSFTTEFAMTYTQTFGLGRRRHVWFLDLARIFCACANG
jgi:hypothetical protein